MYRLFVEMKSFRDQIIIIPNQRQDDDSIYVIQSGDFAVEYFVPSR